MPMDVPKERSCEDEEERRRSRSSLTPFSPRRDLSCLPLTTSSQRHTTSSVPEELTTSVPANPVHPQAAFPYQRDHLPRPRSAHALSPLSRRAILSSRTSSSTICRLKSPSQRHRDQLTMTLNNIGDGTRTLAGRRAAVEAGGAGVRSGIHRWMPVGPMARRAASVSPVRARGVRLTRSDPRLYPRAAKDLSHVVSR